MITVPRRYKHVVRDTDRNGNVRLYLRVPGKPKVRLRETLGTDAFDAEYRAALEAKPKSKTTPKGTVIPGSIDALCVAYFASSEFRRGLGERSQHVRRQVLDRFRAAVGKDGKQHGHRPAADARLRGFLERMKDEHAERPEAFNALLKGLRAAFAAGLRLGLVEHNPALAVRYLASRNPDGFRPWTLDELERFEARWPVGSKPRLALALMLYTGVRRSDVVLLGRQHVRGEKLHFRVTKGRDRTPRDLAIPVVPALAAIIAASPVGELHFLVTEHGRPYSGDGFGNAFRRWCQMAGVPGCSPHGLRKVSALRLAHLGATEHELMAAHGWSSPKQAALYTRRAEQDRLAERAFARLAANEKSHSTPARAEWDENATQDDDPKGYSNEVVPRGGIEPPTLRFSVACSTN